MEEGTSLQISHATQPNEAVALSKVSCSSTARSIAQCFDFWQSLTSDKTILNCVKGYKLEFDSVPVQSKEPCELQFNETETRFVNE